MPISNITELLYYIVVFDALVVLVMGVMLSGIIAFDLKVTDLWYRLSRSVGVLVVTSLAAGVILWIADYMFMGAA